jgi:type IV secretion system protein VirB10
MADPIPFEVQAEDLKLREQPKPTTRINRKVVMAGVGIGGLLLFLATSVALDPPKLDDGEERRELYNTTSRPTAEELAALPTSYSDIKQGVIAAPVLGDPYPGDLGAAIAQTESDLGIAPVQNERITDFRLTPEQENARAERIRLAKIEQESLTAPVFFQLSNNQRSINNGQAAEQSGGGTLPQSAFSALPIRGQSAPSANGFSNSSDPNLQNSKTAFASNPVEEDIYNPHNLQDPVSPYQVMTGTVIAASLLTGLNSDLPGTVLAQVTQPVYDTATGQHLLIPQGSRLIGRYDSRVSFGQARALLVWDRILFPDSTSIQISALPGTDQSGFSGLSDRVDNHYGRLLGAIGLATILGVGSELTFGDDESDLVEAIRDSVQDSTNQAGQRIVDRNLNIQPTIRVRPGWPLRVIVTQDLILRPFQQPTSR